MELLPGANVVELEEGMETESLVRGGPVLEPHRGCGPVQSSEFFFLCRGIMDRVRLM